MSPPFELQHPNLTKRYIPKKKKTEQSLQLQLCRYMDLKHPYVLYRSDFASGLYLPPNLAALHKRMQSSRSFPDFQVIKPSRNFHGCFIEIKKESETVYLKTGPRKGLLTEDPHIQEQALMLTELNKLGYFARFGIGYDSCIRLIEWYLDPNYKLSENTELF